MMHYAFLCAGFQRLQAAVTAMLRKNVGSNEQLRLTTVISGKAMISCINQKHKKAWYNIFQSGKKE